MTKNETVEELTPESRGRWLVTTQGSTHLWDLDHMTWARFPGPRSLAGAFLADAEDLPIRKIGRYPKIGDTSLVYCDSPANPKLCHWRQSSMIAKIERLPELDPKPAVNVFAHDGLVIVNGSAQLFTVNNANWMSPGQACGAAFVEAERGNHALAERIRRAADLADQQAEESASRGEEDDQGAWAYLSGAVKSALEDGLGQEDESLK